MKQFILAAVLLLSAAAVNAQTKEETIEWLKGEGNSLLSLSYKKYISPHKSDPDEYKVDLLNYLIEKVTETQLIIKRIEKARLGTFSGKTTWETDIRYDTIIYKNLLYQESPDPPIEISGSNYWSELTKYLLRLPNGGTIVILADKANPQNALRVVKAINHMAKLSGAKPYKKLFE